MSNRRQDNIDVPVAVAEPVMEPRVNYYFAQENLCNKREEDVLAQEIIYPDGSRGYRILGNSSGKLYDPYNIYGESHNEVRLGSKTWQFKKVSEDVFETYLRFLNTRNNAHLRIAERKLI